MINIASYNASYPLAYYEIGTVYSFYGNVFVATKKPATEDEIQKYSHKLNKLIEQEQNSAIKPVSNIVTGCVKMNRFYAVVVDKVKSDSCIVVMFCSRCNDRWEYYTKKYVVGIGCTTDGRELMPVSTHLKIGTGTDKKVGGITLAGKNKKVGGITKANGKDTTTSSVGGITRVHQANARSGQNTMQTTNSKVGGITRART